MFIITPGFREVPAACKQSLRPHLKVYDDSKDEHCGDQVHEVGQVLSVEGFPQRSHFVRPSGQKMEESDDGSLEFCAWDREKFRRMSSTCEHCSDIISCTGVGLLPLPVLTVVGLKAFHTMVSQMLVAMNKEIPEPRPYPFWSSSSRSRTIMPATNSCTKKRAKRFSLS